MGAELYLYVADDSIDSPDLSRDFLRELFLKGRLNFDDFLTKEETFMAKPNRSGEIIFGKKREPTLVERAKAPFLMMQALNAKISAEEINALRDKFMDRSEKIEDRERDPDLLKHVLSKIEGHYRTLPLENGDMDRFSEDFKKCYSYLDKAILSNKKVLWEYE